MIAWSLIYYDFFGNFLYPSSNKLRYEFARFPREIESRVYTHTTLQTNYNLHCMLPIATMRFIFRLRVLRFAQDNASFNFIVELILARSTRFNFCIVLKCAKFI